MREQQLVSLNNTECLTNKLSFTSALLQILSLSHRHKQTVFRAPNLFFRKHHYIAFTFNHGYQVDKAKQSPVATCCPWASSCEINERVSNLLDHCFSDVWIRIIHAPLWLFGSTVYINIIYVLGHWTLLLCWLSLAQGSSIDFCLSFMPAFWTVWISISPPLAVSSAHTALKWKYPKDEKHQ